MTAPTTRTPLDDPATVEAIIALVLRQIPPAQTLGGPTGALRMAIELALIAARDLHVAPLVQQLVRRIADADLVVSGLLDDVERLQHRTEIAEANLASANIRLAQAETERDEARLVEVTTQRDRMRPVVEAAEVWRDLAATTPLDEDFGRAELAMCEAVDAYRSGVGQEAEEASAPACICPRFRDTGGLRIADLACPVHGVGGTDPGDGPWEVEPECPARPPQEAQDATDRPDTGSSEGQTGSDDLSGYGDPRRDALDQVIRELDARGGPIPVGVAASEEWRIQGINEARLWVERIREDDAPEGES
jgi:hypothetical protein